MTRKIERMDDCYSGSLPVPEGVVFKAADALCGEWNLHYPDAVRMATVVLAQQPPAEVQPCGCGEATCTVPWEPGCGLGKSEQHAVVEAAPPSAPVGVEDKAKAMFEAQADNLAVSWDRQWEPTKDFWRKRAAEALTQQPAAVDGAMVERALAAYLRRQDDGESLYGCVTAALTAALAAQPGCSDNDR